jgi:hypothetical protein
VIPAPRFEHHHRLAAPLPKRRQRGAFRGRPPATFISCYEMSIILSSAGARCPASVIRPSSPTTNHPHYHESIDNLTPVDVYFGRGQTILRERERIKRKTIQHQRLLHKTHAA